MQLATLVNVATVIGVILGLLSIVLALFYRQQPPKPRSKEHPNEQ
jgi:phosphatidylserine synthase